MHGSRVVLVAVSLCTALACVATACGPSEQVEAEAPAAVAGPLPFMIGLGNFSGASFKDGLAFLNIAVFSDAKLSSIGAVLRPDGTWVELPASPLGLTGGMRLGATEDGRLLLAANDCSDTCSTGILRFYELSSGGAGWSEVGGSVKLTGGETGISDIAGSGGTVFATEFGNYTLVGDEIVNVPFTPDRALGSSAVCSSDAYMFAIQSTAQGLDKPIAGPIQETLGSAWAMKPSSWEWTPVSLPPDRPDVVGRGVCTPTGVIFLAGGVEYEYSFDDATWTTVDTGTGWSIFGAGHASAVSSDGELYAVLDSGTVGIRRSPGRWEDTGVAAHAVYRLGDGLVGMQRGAALPVTLP